MTVVLTDEEFGQLRVLLARAAGLAFDDARRDGLAYSIAERLRATGSRDVAAYLAMYQQSQPSARSCLMR